MELCDQILMRFDFEDKFKALSLINPHNIIKEDRSSFSDILKDFSHFVEECETQKIESEFRQLKLLNLHNLFPDKEIKLLSFWKKISEMKKGDSSLLFPTLTNFMKKILVLPHSSANVERVFSQVILNKTKVRNRLEKSSLEAILYTKDHLKLNNCNCFDFKVAPDLIELFNRNIYL